MSAESVHYSRSSGHRPDFQPTRNGTPPLITAAKVHNSLIRTTIRGFRMSAESVHYSRSSGHRPDFQPTRNGTPPLFPIFTDTFALPPNLQSTLTIHICYGKNQPGRHLRLCGLGRQLTNRRRLIRRKNISSRAHLIEYYAACFGPYELFVIPRTNPNTQEC